MKTEIEHIQHLLDTAKVKVQQEFEVWWQSQVVKVTRHMQSLDDSCHSLLRVRVKGQPGRLHLSPHCHHRHLVTIPLHL